MPLVPEADKRASARVETRTEYTIVLRLSPADALVISNALNDAWSCHASNSYRPDRASELEDIIDEAINKASETR